MQVASVVLVALLVVLGLPVAVVWLYGLAGLARSVSSLEPWPVCGRRGRSVSVVVAARDEERRLPLLLDRLLEADERLVEVIVVDDRSRDATPRVVEEYSRRDPRVRLVRSPGPPPGWAPKAYALWLGAGEARGEVLLFLDADTRPRSGQALVAAAAEVAQPRTIVAFVPRFLCRGLVCRASEAFMTGVAHGFYGFHRVRDPRDRLAWMYGCCWAVLRSDYQSLGGHRAVASSIVEDRDFAAHAKRRGYTILPVDARSEVGVESYEDLEGYARLIARLAADKAASAVGARWAAYAAGVLWVLFSPLLAAAPLSLPARAAYASAAVLQLALYSLGSRVNLDTPLLGPLGHLGAVAAALGLLEAPRGAVWRGRLLRPPPSKTPGR
jgi:hypothetical protein